MSSFEGFRESNTTPVPDILFDELLSELSGSELKVLLYIVRRTRGFKKDTDAISLSQFQKGITTRQGKILDKGCGISDRQTIVNALESLEKKKCIESIKSRTTSGDKDVTRYRIYFASPPEGSREIQPPPDDINSTTEVVGKPNHLTAKGGREFQPQVVGNSNRGSRENPTRVVGKSNLQERERQETEFQKTERQEGAAPLPPTNSQPNDLSLSPSLKKSPIAPVGVPSNSPGKRGGTTDAHPSENELLNQLTDPQADFWTRWCSTSGAHHNSLNATSYAHVVKMAEKELTTSEIQELYDATYEHLREVARAKGTKLIPPRLGNIVKFYPQWDATRIHKRREQEEERRDFLVETGHIRNFTQERLAGKIQPLQYFLPPQKREPITGIDFANSLMQFRRRITKEP